MLETARLNTDVLSFHSRSEGLPTSYTVEVKQLSVLFGLVLFLLENIQKFLLLNISL